jgi:ribosomal protein S27AE
MSITYTKDGRTIRTKRSYTEFRHRVYESQHGMCHSCGRNTFLALDILDDRSFHVHHKNGRGLGGSKRDDILEAVLGLCGRCHREEHNERNHPTATHTQ